ncbi:xanthine dehydrogenase family protein molybdopterin-binding subunit [Acidobacteria bacterium AB60]|nr:xanthine dehydrogenase family protein molybdopterin-binding subunit [Acidobacteria bacterium AB60]
MTVQPRWRVDGIAKVTGAAQFGADFMLERLAYGVPVLSTIAKGRVRRFDLHDARSVRGLIEIITPSNALRLPNQGIHPELKDAPRIAMLQDDGVYYSGQVIGLAVAESLEAAQEAASLVKAEYRSEDALCDFEAQVASARPPQSGGDAAAYARGDFAAALSRSDVEVQAMYSTPVQHHNPMEPHATIAHWEGDRLTLYEPSQWIVFVRTCIAVWFGVPEANIRVLGPFVGGGFGGKGALWSHSPLAVMASKMLQRPVKIALNRREVYTVTASRPRTQQKVLIGATKAGELLAIRNDVVLQASPQIELIEDSGTVSHHLYKCDANATSHRVAILDTSPTWVMRAPGEATGSYALESAVDEVAYRVGIDPLELRLRNYAEKDQTNEKPYSQKLLRDCYTLGAKRFGWEHRPHAPRSMRKGNQWIGWGMATATYPAYRAASSAVVRISPDGKAFVGSATHEIGTGTYTVLAQIAAEELGISIDQIDVRTGDTELPPAIYSGGSLTVATVGTAVQLAAQRVKQLVIQMAVDDPASPLHQSEPAQIKVSEGELILDRNGARERYADILGRQGGRTVEATAEAKPGQEIERYSTHSFGAVFAEVGVDPDLFTVRVRRFVGVYDVGRVINKKAGINQLTGGAVWGIGMALFEGAQMDPRYGRSVNMDLSEYHLPAHADIGEMDISVLDVPDLKFNPLGARGMGEMGITGAAAAVANAVFHATGIRIRDLPITIDKLIERSSNHSQ